MSQSPWKTNEGSFLYQITFIYYTCFWLKTQTPCRSLDPGLERCAAGTGKVSGCWDGWVYKPLGKGSPLGLSSGLP